MKADDAPPERLHPLAVVSGLGSALRNMIGGLFAGGFVAFQGQPFWGFVLLAGIVLSAVIGLVLHWWRFSFRVGEEAIRIDSGIFSRNHRTIPFDRVQDVSITQGPLQRLIGVAKVTLETGGGSAMGGEEGALDAVTLTRAEALREYVRVRRGVSVATDADEAEAADEERAPLFTMDGRRVAFLGLFNFSLALFAGLFGASQTLGDAVGIDPFERRFWEPILFDSGLGQYLLDHRFGLAIGGLAVLIVAGIATGIVRTTLREWGFRLERTGNGLRRRRGLLTKTDVSLPRRRVQAGLIDTGPVRERLGWHALSVKSLASDKEAGGEGDHALAPLATIDELSPIAAELGWRMPDEGTVWRPVSRAYVWTFMILLTPILAIASGSAATSVILKSDNPRNIATSLSSEVTDTGLALAGVGLAALTIFVVLTGLRWLGWKRTRYAIENDRLLVRTGWWNRRTFLLPLRNVQSVDLIETSLSRLFRVATLSIGVAGGNLMGHHVPSLPRHEASLLRRTLLSRQP